MIDIRAVRHLVQDRLCVGPEPGDRPEQSAEAKREQAQALDSPELRVVPLFRNLFGENVDQQEDPDSDGRDEDEREPRNAARDCIERLAVKERGVGGSWQRQKSERDEPD